MEPVKPNIEGFPELRLGENQDEFSTLPATLAYDADGNFIIVTRWRLTEEERAAVAAGGDLYLTVLTFGQPFQPVLLGTAPPDMRKERPVQPIVAPKAAGVH